MEYLIADQGDDMSEHGVTYRIPNTFLHGNVETDAGFDIFRIHGKELYDKLCGIESELTCETYILLRDSMIPVVIYCWKVPEQTSFGGIIKGLVCYPDDYEAIKDAKMKQKEKTSLV